MYALIDYALTHDMSQEIEQAYEVIISKHTFLVRVKQMLEILEKK